jgi:hypothetical protein
MATLAVGQSINTKEPTLFIDPGLPVGDYVFQLTVMDQSRNQSRPVQLTVRVIQRIVFGDTVLTGTTLGTTTTRLGTTTTRLTNPFGG